MCRALRFLKCILASLMVLCTLKIRRKMSMKGVCGSGSSLTKNAVLQNHHQLLHVSAKAIPLETCEPKSSLISSMWLGFCSTARSRCMLLRNSKDGMVWTPSSRLKNFRQSVHAVDHPARWKPVHKLANGWHGPKVRRCRSHVSKVPSTTEISTMLNAALKL